MKISFNKPYVSGGELEYIRQVCGNMHVAGNGKFTQKCHEWLQDHLPCGKALLTVSGTAALEMAAILADIREGDEVIMPSYTFPSTANAFVLRGAKVVFIDIRTDTMNIDETLIEMAITKKTRAIVPVHYAGCSCDMDAILDMAKKYGLLVIEDAAQGFMARYKDKSLGTIGDIGCFSFHETKNVMCGEGGGIILNNDEYVERAEIIRDKGTDRCKYFRNEVDKYTWVDIGSSYLPSELNAAFLYAQFEVSAEITRNRLSKWKAYYAGLKPLYDRGMIVLPSMQAECKSNGHIFYIKVKDKLERETITNYLKKNDVHASFHYIPLHSSKAGLKFGRFSGDDIYTTKESERLLRLPIYNELKDEDIERIVRLVTEFYE